MNYFLIALVSYLVGSLNPAALIAKRRGRNLRGGGTGNLGATNVMLHFGKKAGALVMVFDIAKSALCVVLARALFPHLLYADLIAGSAAVVGHVFPFYLKFKGGKGLASFGGLVLAYSPIIFLGLLVLTVALMILVNYSYIMPLAAGILFPVLAGVHTRSLPVFLLAALPSILIIVKHAGNIRKARDGTDVKIRDFLKKGQAKTK